MDYVVLIIVIIVLIAVFLGGLVLQALLYAKGGSALMTWYNKKMISDQKKNTNDYH